MMDMKMYIADKLNRIVNIDSEELKRYIEIPPNTDMGDYAFPCFKLAKELKKAPQIIANEISEKFILDDVIVKIEVVGGYLNIFINKTKLVSEVMRDIFDKNDLYGSSKVGENKSVVIDYSAPNIAKPFHIGHLRSTVIGGSLYKIYKFLGYNVTGINHLGDWGTQFGKLMYAYKTWGNEEDVKREPIKTLFELYVRFTREAENNKELVEEGRNWFKKLEEDDEEAVSLWKWFREVSLQEFDRIYELLNIQFDSYNGEAFYKDKMDDVIDILESKNLLVDSEGARIVDLSEYNMPPCLIVKSNGTTTYATRDLAALVYRKNTYDFDKALYVTSYEQELHFKQIFKVFELMGFKDAQNCEHIPFGMVLMKDGKMSTREGKVIFLESILLDAINKVKDIINNKNPNLEDKDEIARKIGVGAIIFNDLNSGRIKDEIFDWDAMLNFDGETGPYVQFAYVRTQSVLRKAGYLPNINEVDFTLLNEPETIDIVKNLYSFGQVLEQVTEKNEPSLLTRHIINLAQNYSRFYNSNIIMNDDKKIQDARLALTYCVGIVIKTGLSLLGIESPDKM